MAEYIERERIEKFFDGIYDCADLTFEPNDHCCAADDCSHCKWREAMNAIRKRILSIPSADVVERKTGQWIHDTVGENKMPIVKCSECGLIEPWFEVEGMGFALHGQKYANFCPNCGAKLEG